MIWAVTDNQSQAIRNLAFNPNASTYTNAGPGILNDRFTGNGEYSIVSSASDGPPGLSSYARYTVTSSRVRLGFNIADNPDRTNVAYSSWPAAVKPGEAVQIRFMARSSTVIRSTIAYTFFDQAGSNVVQVRTTGLHLNLDANVWTEHACTVTVPNGAYKLSCAQIYPDAPSVGTTLDITGVMIYKAEKLLPYADGNTFGWKWLGAPGDSVSVGYPYTLESIAGQPLAVNTAPGTIAASRPGATIESQDGRSLYSVYSLPDPASQAAEINAISVLGIGNANQAGGMLFRTSVNAGRLDSAVRPGNGNFFRQIDGGRTQGVHVACLSVNDGVSKMTLSVDGGDTLSSSINPGGSMTNTASPTNLELISTGYTTGIAAYGFKGEHNDETRKRITAWFARKYGGVIPSGY